MKVLRADKLGFCLGVEDAVGLAHQAAERCGRVYSLGPLIHNDQVIRKLAESGLETVESLDEVGEGAVLIRAHGVDPTTATTVREQCTDVIDATCVLVRRAQNAVKRLHEEGYHVVVVGDSQHPEVQGIVGYAPEVTVIAHRGELDQLPRNGRIGVLAQTTLAQERFAEMLGGIACRPFREIKVINTLCAEVVHRQEAARALCSEVDVVFVLGGLHSANTRELARLCREQGVRTFHLEDWDSFQPEYVQGCGIAGVTAGSSTPSWIIDRFIDNLSAWGSGP